MSGFTLDEVRDTYAADMTNFVDLIDGAAKTLLSAPPLATPFPRAPNGGGYFEALAAYGHSVLGSSSLIDLKSMSAVAKGLEELATRADELVRSIDSQLAFVRAAASMCQQSGDVIRQLLELELAGRGEEARQKAAEFLPRLESAMTPLPEAQSIEDRARESELTESTAEKQEPVSEGASGFDFEDESVVQPASQATDAEAEELRSVFREEAQGFVDVIEQHLATLTARPKDLAAAQALERVYHTLKGAAATIGLKEVAALAAKLQNTFEPLATGEEQATEQLVAETITLTNNLLRATGLREIGPQKAAKAAPEGDQTRDYFIDEARAIHAQARKLLEILETAAGGERVSTASQLERLFHGLKGSALVLGEKQFAEVAERLQRHSKAIELPGLRGGFDVLAVLLGEADTGSEIRDSSASAMPESESRGSSARQDSGARPDSQSAGSSTNSKRVGAVPPRSREKVVAIDDRELWNAFLQESDELLDVIDKEAIALEQATDPKASLQALFRSIHTLKGAVSSVGIIPTGKMLHVVEDLIEKLLDQAVLPSMKNVTTALLVVQAEIRMNLRQAPNGSVESSQNTIGEWMSAVFAGALNRTSSSAASGSAKDDADSAESVDSKIEKREDMQFDQRRFIRVPTDRLDELMNLAGELVVNRSRLLTRVDVLRNLQVGLGDTRRSLFSRVDEFRQQYEFANLGGKVTSRAVAVVQERAPVAMVRPAKAVGDTAFGFSDIELDRYEDVHILARSLAEIADDLTEMDSQILRELNQISEESDTFGSVISRIQSEVTRTRMISADTLFARLQLPIREAAHQGGKSVDITMAQNEVALDKNIIDSLYKPMLHLVRNAVAHGLESAEERVRSGKKPTGQIAMRARQDAGQIVIEVSDDGRGLQLAALKERGVAAGLVSPDVSLDDPAVKNLVFAPRISTAATVGSVAGRGVGGDVVKKSIERLNGDIRVESSPGEGTTFIITLPVTLLITPALVLRSGGQTFAIPLFFAERIIEVEDRAMVDVLGSYQLRIGDKFIPVRRLEDVWGETAAHRSGPVLLLRIGQRRLALQVDSLVSREEVVVKNLGRLLGEHPLFAGVTARGNGDLVLIIDVPGLMDHEKIIEGVAGRGAATARAEGSTTESSAASASGSAAESQKPAPKPVLRVVSQEQQSSGEADRVEVIKAAAPPPSVEAAPTPVAEPAIPAPPAAKPAAKAPITAVLPLPVEPPLSGKPRILFVDDSLSVRKVAERTLLELGVEVTLAVDGLDALEKLRSAQFDLIFTDLEMPRMHGYELIREVRFMPRFKEIPMVVVSSRSGTRHQEQARSLGASDYLTKPFTTQMLKTAMSQLIPRWKP